MAANSDESESSWCDDRDVTHETQAKVSRKHTPGKVLTKKNFPCFLVSLTSKKFLMILDLQHVIRRPCWFKKQNDSCKTASILLKTVYLKNILFLVKELKRGFSQRRGTLQRCEKDLLGLPLDY